MLILTRRKGEAITVSDNVKLRVLDIKGSQVSIGIEAPKNVGVHREEVYMRIQLEKQSNCKSAHKKSLF